MWNSRNIMFFHTAISSICYGQYWNLLPRNLSIPFTQTRHPFLDSTLCTQHDEDWLRSCRISTHIQTHPLSPYVLVSPLFLFYVILRENSWFFGRDFRQTHSEDVIALYKWSSNRWFSGTRPLSVTESNHGGAAINVSVGRWSDLIFECTFKLFNP